jgi:hypothetical protein
MIHAALIIYERPLCMISPMLTPEISGVESEPFTVAAQDSADLILVGPATAADTYWGGFVRADVATNDYLGQYHYHRKDHPPI